MQKWKIYSYFQLPNWAITAAVIDEHLGESGAWYHRVQDKKNMPWVRETSPLIFP